MAAEILLMPLKALQLPPLPPPLLIVLPLPLPLALLLLPQILPPLLLPLPPLSLLFTVLVQVLPGI